MPGRSKIRCTTFYLSMFTTQKNVFGAPRTRAGFTPPQVAHMDIVKDWRGDRLDNNLIS